MINTESIWFKVFVVAFLCLFAANNIAMAAGGAIKGQASYKLSASSMFTNEIQNINIAEFKEETGFRYFSRIIGIALDIYGEKISAEGMNQVLRQHIAHIDFTRFMWEDLYKDGDVFCVPYFSNEDGTAKTLRYYLTDKSAKPKQGASIIPIVSDGRVLVCEGWVDAAGGALSTESSTDEPKLLLPVFIETSENDFDAQNDPADDVLTIQQARNTLLAISSMRHDVNNELMVILGTYEFLGIKIKRSKKKTIAEDLPAILNIAPLGNIQINTIEEADDVMKKCKTFVEKLEEWEMLYDPEEYLLELDEFEPSDPENEVFRGAIYESAHDIDHIIDRLLGSIHGVYKELEKEKVDINHLVREVEFSMHLPVDVKVKLASDPVEVIGDKTAIRNVLINLMKNAARAMNGREDRVLEIMTRLVDGGRSIEIVVEDTGKGIMHENLEHVFEPYFSTEKQNGGTGLGLWNVKELIEAHGGTITVHSQSAEEPEYFYLGDQDFQYNGFSTVFTIKLPAAGMKIAPAGLSFRESLIGLLETRAARSGRRGGKLIIGIDTSWIPKVQRELLGMQNILKEFKRVSRHRGFEDIIICVDDRPDRLAAQLSEALDVDNEESVLFSDMVIVGEEKLKSFGSFDRLFTKAFFAKMDLSNAKGERLDLENVDINLPAILTDIFKNLQNPACGHEFYVKIPNAEEVGIENLNKLYDLRAVSVGA